MILESPAGRQVLAMVRYTAVGTPTVVGDTSTGSPRDGAPTS